MPNRKLTELPTLSPINFDSTDLLYIVDVQTDISKKIPYSLLAGDSLIALSAYASQNTLNVDYLSGSIYTNTAAIATLEGGGLGLQTQVTEISTNLQFLSTDTQLEFDSINAQLSLLETGSLSTFQLQLDNLSANQDFIENALIFGDGTGPIPTPYFTFDGTFSGQAIYTTDRVDYLSGEIDTNTAAIALNTSYVSQVSVTPTAETPAQSHTVPISIGGVTYKILLAT